MITVILEDSDGSEVSRIGLSGNERYLIRDEPAFPYLSQLSEFSYDVFSSADMEALIGELTILCDQLSEQESAHVSDIISLAAQCRGRREFTLTFTPFE